MPGGLSGAGADQLGALLVPHPTAAGEHPRRTGTTVVVKSTCDCGVAVGGQRDGNALVGGSNRTGADQFGALLTPHPTAAGEHPHRTGTTVVEISAHDGGVPVSGQRDGLALLGASNRTAADQLGSISRQFRDRSMREHELCSRRNHALALQNIQVGVPRNFPQGQNDLRAQQRQFALQIPTAIQDFRRQRLVCRRGAAHGRGDKRLVER